MPKNDLYFILLLFSSAVNALVLPPAVVHTACGFVAGSAGAVAAYPIDFVKSLLQTEAGRAKYSGGWEAAMDILKTEGPFGLYRGLPIQILGVAPEKTIKLSVNEAVRNAITMQLGYLPIAGEAFAGGMAGLLQVSVTNPLEFVKVRLQTSQMSFAEVMSQVKKFGDLYTGAAPCIARDMTFSAVLFPTYAHLKVGLAGYLTSSVASGGAADADTAMFLANMIAGSVAAAPAAIIATPPDVVKTRMQQAREHGLQDLGAAAIPFPEKLEMGQVIRDLMDEGGIQIMFSGCFERVVRSAPQFGVTLAVFDVLNSIALEHGWVTAV